MVLSLSIASSLRRAASAESFLLGDEGTESSSVRYFTTVEPAPPVASDILTNFVLSSSASAPPSDSQLLVERSLEERGSHIRVKNSTKKSRKSALVAVLNLNLKGEERKGSESDEEEKRRGEKE